MSGNSGRFETLIESMKGIAEDTSDPPCQRMALTFLCRAVSVWGRLPGTEGEGEPLPGFERFMYERLVPMAFQIPSSPTFNMKDGQVLVVGRYLILLGRS